VAGEAVAGLPGGSHRGDAEENSRPVADLAGWAAGLVEPVKPRLRGWLHAAMVPASLSAGIVLICLARTPATWACAVYAVTAWLLFGTSAVYHLGTWAPGGRWARPFCGVSTTPTSF
jgi:hemolysin III